MPSERLFNKNYFFRRDPGDGIRYPSNRGITKGNTKNAPTTQPATSPSRANRLHTESTFCSTTAFVFPALMMGSTINSPATSPSTAPPTAPAVPAAIAPAVAAVPVTTYFGQDEHPVVAKTTKTMKRTPSKFALKKMRSNLRNFLQPKHFAKSLVVTNIMCANVLF